MNSEHSRPSESGIDLEELTELDLLACLWQEVPFVRLPRDAPVELKGLVENIENPKRVYTIHRASRRHNFQLLVQKYIVQLRDGCGFTNCPTATCFSCRKRLVGDAPIRIYNTTSARALAVHLASQDNVKNRLCPNLKLPKTPPAALASLTFAAQAKIVCRDEQAHGVADALAQSSCRSLNKSPRRKSKKTIHPSPVKSSWIATGNGNATRTRGEAPKEASGAKQMRGPSFSVVEEPVSKDHRSFAANLIGTVAFKMLEWLTPTALHAMAQKAEGFQNGEMLNRGREEQSRGAGATRESAALQSKQEPHPSCPAGGKPPSSRSQDSDKTDSGNGELREQQDLPRSRSTQPSQAGKKSNNKVRRSSGVISKRQLYTDPLLFAVEALSDEPRTGSPKSPRAYGQSGEWTTKGPKASNCPRTRPISHLSSNAHLGELGSETMRQKKQVIITTRPGLSQTDGAGSREATGPLDSSSHVDRTAHHQDAIYKKQKADVKDHDILPQALSSLNIDVVDFICDVLQRDGTAERHTLVPRCIDHTDVKIVGERKLLGRERCVGEIPSVKVRLEWKSFIEQSLFYIMSDPHLVIRSFCKRDQLYDSQTLWWCMLRMTRVAPGIILHSLWMAAENLFRPPKTLHTLRSPTAKLFPSHGTCLSNTEAGRLVSICLHALLAIAPVVNSERQLLGMSRIRAHGLSLAGSSAVAQQAAELCLQYEDAFTNNHALRLASRLFSSITARRSFEEMENMKLGKDGESEGRDGDVLTPLLSQLDFCNTDAVYVLNFSLADRSVHEKRVPILLLDWARTVMMQGWDGDVVVPADGSMGGALYLMKDLYKERRSLLLPDAEFQSEYFSDRLDNVQAPVSWLAHTSTRQKLHLLDFAFIFEPSTLVSYFRAINFSSMSRAYEASSSLQERIDMLNRKLVISSHGRYVLEDLLGTAMPRYLVLDIRRREVLKDAFDQVWRREERELARPLKIRLGESEGEEGFDSGGVQQEFFRLVMAEALNPDYGAFTVDTRSQMTWFQPASAEPEWKFELVGLLFSLAVYNGLTLPVTFPLALYRKLLGQQVTELHHIEDGWSHLASGLGDLLEWDEKNGTVEDVFTLTYEFSIDVLGKPVTREMKSAPSPSSPSSSSPASMTTGQAEAWPQIDEMTSPRPSTETGPYTGPCTHPKEAPLVTRTNRDAYVSDYIRYLTDVSVRPQFDAFARGFRTLLHPKALSLFGPELLQSVVEGVQDIDVNELRRHTRYVGWDATHRTVRDFWSVVRRYDDGMRRRLLAFVTASDRVPVGGVKNLQFVLQRNGVQDGPGGHLPTTYTCYGILLLPEYGDKETLRERLAMALENSQGFGFA